MPHIVVKQLKLFALILLLSFCSQGETEIVNSGGEKTAKQGSDGSNGDGTETTSDATGTGDTLETGDPVATSTPVDIGDKAYLHVNLWTKFHNFRSRCGIEASFAWMCKNVKGLYPGVNCDETEDDAQSCNPDDTELGFIGPEKQGEAETCGVGKFPDVGGCDYNKWDLDGKLQFYWFGPKWSDNFAISTLKVFDGTGAYFTDENEIIGLSNMSFDRGRSKSGVEKRGLTLGHGCFMAHEEGADRFKSPFGGFAWVEVPTDKVVTITAIVGAAFTDAAEFARHDGIAPLKTMNQSAEDYWKENPPSGGNRDGYSVYVEEFQFEKGKQYYWGHGSIREVQNIPDDIKLGFSLYNNDVSSPENCKHSNPDYFD